MPPFDRSARLPAGKLPPEMLDELLSALPERSRRILTGPGVGEDAAIISFGETSLVAKTDPVTFATDLIGWYAVHVNANDIAATGATPKWFLPTVLLPEQTEASVAESIFAQIREAADSIGVELVGGHTEITVGMPRPIISGAMLGEAPASKTISTSGATRGDKVILTKGIAVEGGSLLAREFGELAMSRGVASEDVDTAANYLFEPGISVLRDAQIATAAGTVTAMHDPTEGGLATALSELSTACGHGLSIDAESVPILDECERLCAALEVDPWGLIASGALLICCAESSAPTIISALKSEGIYASVIGDVTDSGSGVMTHSTGEKAKPVARFSRDEIARLFTELA